MATLTVQSFVTLDGVYQAPGGPDEDRSGGFAHGGWSAPLWDDAMLDLVTQRTQVASALLLGRKTYEIFAASWPLADADDPIGAKLNSMPKYVVSRTLDSVAWANSTLLSGDVIAAVTELKAAVAGEIQVHGSGELIQPLLANDLVDEFQLYVFPVLLGSGRKLFAEGTVPAGLRLLESTVAGTGVIAARYARAGSVEVGAMGPETGNW